MRGHVTIIQSEDGKPKASFCSQVDSKTILKLGNVSLNNLAELISQVQDRDIILSKKIIKVEHQGKNVKISWEVEAKKQFCLFRTHALLAQIAPAKVSSYHNNFSKLPKEN